MEIELKAKAVREAVGTTIWYKLNNDPRYFKDSIVEVSGRNILLESNGDWLHFNRIQSIRIDDPDLEK